MTHPGERDRLSEIRERLNALSAWAVYSARAKDDIAWLVGEVESQRIEINQLLAEIETMRASVPVEEQPGAPPSADGAVLKDSNLSLTTIATALYRHRYPRAHQSSAITEAHRDHPSLGRIWREAEAVAAALRGGAPPPRGEAPEPSEAAIEAARVYIRRGDVPVGEGFLPRRLALTVLRAAYAAQFGRGSSPTE